MAPFTAFSTLKWANAPVQLSRYNGLPSLELQGSPAPGVSTGTAMKAMEEMQAKLPPGTALQWTGLSYEEQQSSGQAPALYGLSLLIVFLCLAALYESWTIPLAVLLVVPLGIVGALLGAKLTGLDNNIYLQVGLITTMGLALQERDPDRRVRRGADARRRELHRIRGRRRAAAASPDPDDQPGASSSACFRWRSPAVRAPAARTRSAARSSAAP